MKVEATITDIYKSVPGKGQYQSLIWEFTLTTPIYFPNTDHIQFSKRFGITNLNAEKLPMGQKVIIEFDTSQPTKMDAVIIEVIV